MRTLLQRRCHLTTEQEHSSSCCSRPPALAVQAGAAGRVWAMCVICATWSHADEETSDGSGIVHCDGRGACLYVCVRGVWALIAHVNNQFTACTCDREMRGMGKKSGRGGVCESEKEVGEREREKKKNGGSVESVIWLLRNSTGDSCRYTRSDSLPLQLCEPHAQYDFTTSSPSLEIPLFFLSLLTLFPPVSVTLTESQVHVLVTPLLRRRVRASPGL